MSPEIELLVWLRAAAATGELRRVRVANRLSLEDTAATGPVHPMTVSRWERGERRPVRSEAALRYAQTMRELQRSLEAA